MDREKLVPESSWLAAEGWGLRGRAGASSTDLLDVHVVELSLSGLLHANCTQNNSITCEPHSCLLGLRRILDYKRALGRQGWKKYLLLRLWLCDLESAS